jgi:hypothetical protein
VSISASPNSDGSITVSCAGPAGTNSVSVTCSGYSTFQANGSGTTHTFATPPGTNYQITATYFGSANQAGTVKGTDSTSATAWVTPSISAYGSGSSVIVQWSAPSSAAPFPSGTVPTVNLNIGGYSYPNAGQSGNLSVGVGYFTSGQATITASWGGFSNVASAAWSTGAPPDNPPNTLQVRTPDDTGWVRVPTNRQLYAHEGSGSWHNI